MGPAILCTLLAGSRSFTVLRPGSISQRTVFARFGQHLTAEARVRINFGWMI